MVLVFMLNRSIVPYLGTLGLIVKLVVGVRTRNGEYNYNPPTDQHLVRFLGLDREALSKGNENFSTLSSRRTSGERNGAPEFH